MRNQEAARYARWAAMTAGAITLIVAGFYSERAIREYIARRHGPPPVPVSVEQQSADFSYSNVQDGRTTFTIRASHATRFKDEDRALLQDVWVTIYGKQGDRNDNIHTRECSYQPEAGNVLCAGDVEIDVQAAAGPHGKPTGPPLQVKTSNLTFNRKSGEASTPAPVNLTFPGGEGHGTGLNYDSNESLLRIGNGVDFRMTPSTKTGGLALSATAANLEFHRDEHAITLGGPVVMHQGDRELDAELVSIGLDDQYHAQHIAAQGSPVLRGAENGAAFTVSAEKFQGSLDGAGVVEQIIADGNVDGSRKTRTGDDQFSASHVEFAMVPGRNLVKDMTATGGVTAISHSGANVRTLKSDALRLAFAAPAAKTDSSRMDKQQIQSAETLGAATIESKEASDTLNLKASKFGAEFGADGRLARLLGHSGVEIKRTPATGDAQTSTASELVATFGPGGDWSTLDETGKVRLVQDGKEATAAHARVVGESDAITLDGSPVFSDGASRTSAGTSVTINQKTGEVRATGGVVSTQLAANTKASPDGKTPPANQISLGEGDAHISAETLTGSTNTGDVTFLGNARLWQGQAVLDADQIVVLRDAGKLAASGHVIAVFPQDASQGPPLPGVSSGRGKQSQPKRTPGGQTIWKVQADRLTYLNSQSIAHLEGGVTASSDQGSLQSKTLDVYLALASTPPSQTASAFGARGLDRVVAQGDVIVAQADVHGYSQQAEYDARRGKFTLSGGEPTITDGNGNTTTGRSLTFYVASDTILIDSDEGSRTLTRHRVEK